MLLFPLPKIMLSKEETSEKKSEILPKFAVLSVLRYIHLNLGLINFYSFSTFCLFHNFVWVLAKNYFLHMPHNPHYFTYFTTRYDIILLSLVKDTRYFAPFFICMDLYVLLSWFQMSICLLQGPMSRDLCSIGL